MKRRGIGRAVGSIALGALGGGAPTLVPAAFAQAGGVAAPRLRDVRRFGGKRDALGLLDQPLDVAVDGRGVLYVADFDNHRVQRFGPDRTALGAWGGEPGDAPGRFSSPMAVAVTADGSVFVADTGNHRIQMLSPDGAVIHVWPCARVGLSERGEPVALRLAPDGSLVVVERTDGRVVRLSASGAVLAAWNGSHSGTFARPSAVALGAGGDLFVAELMDGAVRRLAPDGSEHSRWSEAAYEDTLERPSGVALDRMGSLYVSDAGAGSVFKYTSTGIALDRWGTFTRLDDEAEDSAQYAFLSSPRGVTSNGAGTLYVADAGEHRVYAFNAGGRLLRVWGAPPETGSRGAQPLETPVGVATDSEGNVYVTDTGLRRIVKLAPDGRALAAWQLPLTESSERAPAQPRAPSGLAIDAAGFVYVTEGFGTRIFKLSSGGEVVATWNLEGASAAEHFRASHLALDQAGNVYTIENYGTEVLKLSPAGERLGVWGGDDGPLAGAVGIAVDAAGTVHVLDAENNQLVQFGGDGKHLGAWDVPVVGARFDAAPEGLATDAAGGLLVAYGGPLGLVRRFSSDGRLLAAAQVGSGEDTATTYLSGIAVDRGGRVYVADWGASRLYFIA